MMQPLLGMGGASLGCRVRGCDLLSLNSFFVFLLFAFGWKLSILFSRVTSADVWVS